MNILPVGGLIAALLPGVLAAQSAHPVPCAGDVLLHCAVDGGKTVTLCHDTSGFGYTYGVAGAAEVSISVPLTDAIAQAPWQGMGRSINNGVTLPDGDESYTIWTSVDRVAGDESPISAGVIVRQGTAQIAAINCLPQPEPWILSSLGIEDTMLDAGFAYDEDRALWLPR